LKQARAPGASGALPEPLVHWILRRMASGPVTPVELLTDAGRITGDKEGVDSDEARALLDRLTAQGYIQWKPVPRLGGGATALRLTSKAAKYLDDLASHPVPGLVPRSLGGELVSDALPPARFNRPAGPSAHANGISLAALEARAAKLSPEEKERVLRDYAVGLEAQLDWTNRLIRDERLTGPAARRRIR